MASVPAHLKYTKEHEWVEELSPTSVRIGITDYAQSALGDIVYIQLPKVGQDVTAGKICGEVESTKSVSELYAPVSGKISKVNEALDSAPELMNSAPYGEGWFAEVDSSIIVEPLLSAAEYEFLIA